MAGFMLNNDYFKPLNTAIQVAVLLQIPVQKNNQKPHKKQ